MSAVRYLLILALSLAVVGSTASAQSPDRLKPPPPGPAPSLKLPVIQKHALSNGLPVWIVEMHEVPVVDLTLIVKAGASADPAGKFGLAHLTAAMLDEGAGTRSALELADAIDFLGATLTTSSSFDASTVQLHALTTQLDAALPLWSDVVMRPTFPSPELERLRKERLTELLQARDNAATLASRAFARLLYGATHRFGTAVMGTTSSNTTIAAGDLRAFYQTNYQPANAHLLVVGDVTAGTLLPKLEGALAGWKTAAPVGPRVLPPASQPTARQVYLIDKPGAAQSQIRIGGIGVARSTPDYFVLDVMNTIFGGSFTSRLNQNLRETHGYSYGASSLFDMRLTPGPFFAGAGVQTDKTTEALQEFFKEFAAIQTPVPADELARAKNLEALSFPAGFETTQQMAGQLAALVVYNLPELFFGEYVQKIQAVASADVQRAAKQYLPSDRFLVIVVGDLSVIEKPIRAANVGPVTIVPVDDVLR